MWRHLFLVENSFIMNQNVSNWRLSRQYFDIKKGQGVLVCPQVGSKKRMQYVDSCVVFRSESPFSLLFRAPPTRWPYRQSSRLIIQATPSESHILIGGLLGVLQPELYDIAKSRISTFIEDPT